MPRTTLVRGKDFKPRQSGGSCVLVTPTSGCLVLDLVPGGGQHIPLGAERVASLAGRLTGSAVAGERVERVPAVGDLGRSVAELRRAELRRRDARSGERQRDRQQAPRRRRAERGGGFLEAWIDALDRGADGPPVQRVARSTLSWPRPARTRERFRRVQLLGHRGRVLHRTRLRCRYRRSW